MVQPCSEPRPHRPPPTAAAIGGRREHRLALIREERRRRGAPVIKDPPSGAVLKVRVLALNGSLEAPSGPEARVSVV
jgi:hypothetical protein